jgi:hypothetical protein
VASCYACTSLCGGRALGGPATGITRRGSGPRRRYGFLAVERRACAAAAAQRHYVIPVGRRLRTILAVCGSAVALVYLASAGCGRGGRGYFSPDTLDCRTHSEWLVPLTRVPVYRGTSSTHRYAAVDWLIAQGFWSKSDASDPRWLSTFQWNQQWKDGQSQFHRELGWRGDAWVEWSKANPDMARALWPKVLSALRQPGVEDIDAATNLMHAAQYARTVDDFNRMADELAAARPRG